MSRIVQSEQKPDIFVFGLTGAGKDTVGNYIAEYYDYRKIRIAGTIKQIICEKYGFTPEELEKQKRLDPNIRMEHHNTSKMLGDQQGSLNRTRLITEHNTFDLQLVSDPEKPLFVLDCRTFDEALVLLEGGFYGIFLNRTTKEFKLDGHFTEGDLFKNGQLNELLEEWKDKILLVYNGDTDIRDENYLNSEFNLIDEETNHINVPLASKHQLIEAVDSYVSLYWFPEDSDTELEIKK